VAFENFKFPKKIVQCQKVIFEKIALSKKHILKARLWNQGK
jgi:hypothetical protein